MTDKPENPPAFPINGGVWDEDQYGMTLRDYMATKAMGAFISTMNNVVLEGIPKADHVSKWAYAQAGAMLEARES
jgi:hypothetical protein